MTMKVLRGPAKGMRFVAAPGMGVAYMLGTDAAFPRFFARWIRLGDTVYDVGANKGQSALLFASLVGPAGRVIAVEPSPVEHSALVENLRLNAIANVSCYMVGAYDRAGEMDFQYSAEHSTQGKLAGVEPSYKVDGAITSRVTCITLDSLLSHEPAPDVVKIDVEGGAAAVLRGARQIIEERRPAFFLELHGPEEQRGVRDELLSRGYVAETVSGVRVPDPTAGWNSPLWCHSSAGRSQRR